MTLVEWLLAAALFFAPPAKHKQFEGHEETAAEARARYEAIAADIAAAVGTGKNAKSDAALLLAWAIGETGLYRDADIGPCYRPKGTAYRMRCDGGAAAGLWQMHAHVRKDGTKVTTDDIFADRQMAAETMLARLRASWRACAHLPEQDRFSQAGIGRCLGGPGEADGNKSVRARYALWKKLRGWRPLSDPSSVIRHPSQEPNAQLPTRNSVLGEQKQLHCFEAGSNPASSQLPLGLRTFLMITNPVAQLHDRLRAVWVARVDEACTAELCDEADPNGAVVFKAPDGTPRAWCSRAAYDALRAARRVPAVKP